MKKYEVKYQEEGKIKSKIIESENIKSEALPSNIISIVELKIKEKFFKKKAKSSDIVALFSELDIMLSANILLNDAVDILYKNTKKQEIKQILFKLSFALKNGKQIDVELEPYKNSLGSLPLIFLKIAQENGNLKKIMSSLSTILKNKKESKDAVISSLRYPAILFFSLFGLILFSFYFVVPKFEHLFLQYETNLPLATKWLLSSKEFIHSYFLYIAMFFVVVAMFFYLQYKNSENFRESIDKFIILKIPFLSKFLLYNQFQRLFLTTSILLDDKYKFQTAFLNSIILVENSYITQKLKNINQQIQSGKSILFAFENSGLFDDFILRLISVGEESNSLNITISEIEKIYKKRVEDALKSVVFYIEPLFLLLTSSFIVWLMLAIFMPIWNLNEAINM